MFYEELEAVLARRVRRQWQRRMKLLQGSQRRGPPGPHEAQQFSLRGPHTGLALITEFGPAHRSFSFNLKNWKVLSSWAMKAQRFVLSLNGYV